MKTKKITLVSNFLCFLVHKFNMRQTLAYNLNFLICTLYTLISENKNFKSLNLKYDTYLYTMNKEYFSDNKNNLSSFINKISIRRFASILIKPILTKNVSFVGSVKNDELLAKQVFLLKKYLKKFRYNYNRYFCDNNLDYGDLPSNKEINSHAIEHLFLLVGIN